MKKKTNITVTATVVVITSLMITVYHAEPPTSLVSSQIAPVSEVVEADRATTPPTATEPHVAEEAQAISIQTEEFIEPITIEAPPPQPTEKEETNNTSVTPAQSSTKANDTQSTTPKNGDTRNINGQQQGYLIGFGWVDYMGENTCTIVYDMYENGNKIGIMGDINKIVGSMD